MATPKPKNVYPCSMAELYTICRMGWNSFIANIAEFSDFLTSYTAQYGQDALDEVDAAEAMPEFQERNEQAELALVKVKETAKAALKQWKFLRNYIRLTFPANEHKAKWESAGSDHYPKASNQNWSELRNMLTAGNNFLIANAGTFSASGVPAAFATNYTNARKSFNDAFVDFTNLEQDEVEGTDLKVIANNAVYHKLMDMFEDGTLLFEDIPAKQERFVFAHLKEIITHAGNGNSSSATDISIKGVLTDSATGNALADETVSVQLETSVEVVSAVSSTVGEFKLILTGISANYMSNAIISVEVSGYEPFEIIIPVEAGKSYLQDIALVPLAPPIP
jgi:hypothetical protein